MHPWNLAGMQHFEEWHFSNQHCEVDGPSVSKAYVSCILNSTCWTCISTLDFQGPNLSMGSGQGHCLGMIMKHNMYMVTIAPQGCFSKALALQLWEECDF
jgi:hypothetical protein